MSESRRLSTGSGSDSATRLSRVEERDTLHNLNSRLQLFLSRMKELEARNTELQSKLDMGSSASQKVTDSMHALMEKQIQDLRAASEKDTELIAELKGKLAALQASSGENIRSNQAMKAKAERAAELEGKLRVITDERDRLAAALKDAERRADVAEQAAVTSESKATVLEKKLAPLRDQLQTSEELRRKETAAYRSQISELSTANKTEVARIQADYDKQLQAALAAAKKRADEERAAEVAQLAEHFNVVEAQLTREAKDERASKEAALARAAELGKTNDQLQSRADASEKRAAAAEKNLTERARQHEATVAELDSLLHQARAARKEKEGEFNDLMDVKISLDEELKTYRLLLEQEEQRLGYTPEPVRAAKRRRVAKSGPVPYLAQVDLENDCFTVQNAGDEACVLGGYSVKAGVADSEGAYEFPADFELLPGSSVTVWSGKKNQRKKRDPQAELWWTARYMWNNEGDTGILLGPGGEEVNRVTAPANGVGNAPDPTVGEGGDAGGGADSGGQCAIM
mmetsp:Transcript_21472/g.67117  ORF Transcript_21472/g.67117 Transcript_21472/m.67117 type:complete len:516 (-) Transcript_21472:477-2024(-)